MDFASTRLSKGNSPSRIAIFDYKITRNNPLGSCHLAMLRALAEEHDFTVFAVEFENTCSHKIRFVRVPAPMRPLALLFVVYQFIAPLCYLLYRLRDGAKADLVQALESNHVFGDLLYSHFCHGMYLKHHCRKSGAKGHFCFFRQKRLPNIVRFARCRATIRVYIPRRIAAETTDSRVKAS